MTHVIWLSLMIAGGVLCLYLLAGIIGVMLRRLLGRPIRPGSGDGNGFRDGLYFGTRFLIYLLAAHLVGLVGGILYYLLISPLLGSRVNWEFILTKGAANGVFFLGWVWGPGLALVGCFIHARKLGRKPPGSEIDEGSNEN